MTSTLRAAMIVFYAVALHFSSALGTHSGLSGFSPDFLRDYNAAQQSVDESKSAEPLLALLAKYTNATEMAELELSIGLLYGQRTDLVDPAKAVGHFTAALRYELPERTYIEILMWRGNSQEQLKQRTGLSGIISEGCWPAPITICQAGGPNFNARRCRFT